MGGEREGQGRGGTEMGGGKEGRERKGKDGGERGPPLFKSTHLGPSLFACERRMYTASGQVFVVIQ